MFGASNNQPQAPPAQQQQQQGLFGQQQQQNAQSLFSNAQQQQCQPVNSPFLFSTNQNLFNQQQQVPNQPPAFAPFQQIQSPFNQYSNQNYIPQQNALPIQPPQLFQTNQNIFNGNAYKPQQQGLSSLFGHYDPQSQNVFNGNFADDEEIPQVKEDAKISKLAYDLEKNISFEVKTQYKMGKLLKERNQYLPGIVSVKTSDAVASESDVKGSRVGVDLLCLIDKSGSMGGEKIQMVRQTLNLLLNFLSDKDRLQLITFETSAQRITPLKRVTDGNKQYFQQQINGIQAGGGTYISSATQIAFQQLQQRKYRNNVTSIFLLSDGQDGSAETNVASQLQTVDEVFTMHSFGFGADHDAKMMTALCNLKSGSFYFVQNIQLLDEFFVDALGGLISVVGEQLEININCQPQPPYQDIKIHKTYGKMWTQRNPNRQYSILLPQIASGSRKDFVFELGLPQFDQVIGDNQRNALIIQAELKLKNPTNGQVVVKNTTLSLTFFNIDEKINNNEEDIDVAAQYYRVKGADVIDDARRACEQNKHEDAQNLIANMIVQIQKNPKVAQQSAGIIQDLQQAKQGSTRQTYAQFGQQQMCQMVSNNYQQQGVNALFSAQGVQMQQPSQAMYQNQVQAKMVQKVQASKGPFQP